ncbi:MAG: EAL domain-containing protein, partial [Rhodocyclaceae bacterium]|nr:EAL domain-containing protein [Rhodocyclaceae bacterium]
LLGLPRDEPLGDEGHALWLHGQAGGGCAPDCPVLAAGSPGGGNLKGQQLFHRRDGSTFSADFVCTALRERGRTTGAVLIFRDASERVAAEKLLNARVALSETALHGALGDILREAVDAAERLTDSTVGFFHFVGAEPNTVEFTVWSSNTLRGECRMTDVSGPHPVPPGGVWAECVASRQPVIRNAYGAESAALPDGHASLRRILTVPLMREGVVWALASVGNKARDYEAQDAVVVGELMQTALEIHERKRAEDRLRRLTFFDELTELPNRVLLADRLQIAMSQAVREGSAMAVCVLDLDGFKPVNDRYGRHGGDHLLRQVAERLRTQVREGDTLARLGGDEFGLLVLRTQGLEDCVRVAERVLQVFDMPFEVEGNPIPLAASMCITVYPNDHVEAEALIRHADQAMYAAKQDARSRYKLFDSEFDRRARAHQEIIANVEEGLAAGEFRLYYQPKVDMRRGCVIGAEALIRWQHPQDGLLPPARYMPVVDASDIAAKVGEWVLDTALAQMAAWSADGFVLPVSVNISATQLQAPEFVERLRALLAAYPSVPAHRLELEILETATLRNLGDVARVIQACQGMGVRFALDDFGTGYSSLTYLRNLPADVLKIDQSFVRDMLDDPEDMAIVEGVIGLSTAFRRKTIAEGVERTSHGVVLIQLGCDLAQGYGISRPMPADQMVAWARNWKPPKEWELACLVSCPREDLPLLIMESEHRLWLERIAERIELGHASNEGYAVDDSQCFVGRWLRGPGGARHGDKTGFAEFAAAHERVHAVARELLELARTDLAAARARLADLYAASRDLNGELNVVLSAALAEA